MSSIIIFKSMLFSFFRFLKNLSSLSSSSSSNSLIVQFSLLSIILDASKTIDIKSMTFEKWYSMPMHLLLFNFLSSLRLSLCCNHNILYICYRVKYKLKTCILQRKMPYLHRLDTTNEDDIYMKKNDKNACNYWKHWDLTTSTIGYEENHLLPEKGKWLIFNIKCHSLTAWRQHRRPKRP